MPRSCIYWTCGIGTAERSNEAQPVATEIKVGLVHRLQEAGMRYAVLTPNMKGFEAAIAAPRAEWPDEIVVFGAASAACTDERRECGWRPVS